MNTNKIVKVHLFAGWGVAIAILLLLACLVESGVQTARADEEQTVTKRNGEITNNRLHRQDSSGADESNAESVTIPASKGPPVRIQSKTFVAPGGWHFAPLSGDSPDLVDAFNNGLFSFSPVVTPETFGSVPRKVRVEWTTGEEPLTMDRWALGAEGNLRQDPHGHGAHAHAHVAQQAPRAQPAHWAALVKTLCVQLGVDSRNEYGPMIPDDKRKDLLQRATSDKQATPGKVVLTNINDDNDNGVPDYADYGDPNYAQSAPDRSLVPLLVAVPAAANLAGVKVMLEYDMAQYDATGDQRVSLGTSDNVEFFDYRKFRKNKGQMRLWKMADASGKRDPSKTVNQSGMLVKAGEQMDAASFFAGGATLDMGKDGANAKVVKLWVEGMNEGSGTVKAKLFRNGHELTGCGDEVKMAVAELSLGFNNENRGAVEAQGNLANTALLPGTPDVEWKIDEFDQVTKDQGRGYPLWVAKKLKSHADEKTPQSGDGEGGLKDVSGSIDPMEIEGTHPVVLKVSDNVYSANLKVLVRVQGAGDHTGFSLYKGVSPRGDLLAYHRNTQTAEQQCGESPILTITNQWKEIPKSQLQAGDNVLVLKSDFLTTFDGDGTAVGGGDAEIDRTVSVQLAVSADAADQEKRMQGDQTKCWYGDNFYETWNFWASKGVVVSTPPQAPMQERNHYNPQAKYVLAHTHGYNYNSLEDAKNEFDQYYRRFYRAGFRGNYVTMTWPSGDASDLGAAIGLPGDFDNSTINGFKSAPLMLEVLRNSILPRADGARNVDFYTHSHGNLPLWQMLKRSNGVPLFHNVFGSEAAVWTDGLMSPGTITYKDVKTESGIFPDRILGPGALDSVTWSDWWGNRGLAAIDGKYFHGYNHYDDALWNKMRVNEWMKRESGAGYPTWLAGVLGGPNLAMMVGGTDFTCKDADERSRAELGNYYVAHTIGEPRPQVHLALQGDHLTPGVFRVENATAGKADNEENVLSVEVPDLLDMRYLTPTGQRMEFEASEWIMPLPLVYVYTIPLDDYIFSHLRYAHGCGITPLTGEPKVGGNYNMTVTYNWSEWMHAGHRDQSYPAEWNFYSTLLFHHGTPGDWTIFKTGKDR